MIIDYQGVELHRKELTVLRGVNLQVDAGQFVYLIGKVGSGKSTLLKSLYADVPIDQGSAMVLDYDMMTIRRKDIPYLRRKIGFVFQDFQLLTDRNVYANLDFVLQATGWRDKAQRDIRIDEVLTLVGMYTKSYKMPHELSGGEQQRIAIARAMLNNPPLVLADEPTGNLDPATGAQILDTLHSLSRQGTAVVMATHNHAYISQYPGVTYLCADKRLTPQ